MVTMSFSPRTEAANARPIPVLPEVGSMRVSPFFSSPVSILAVIIFRAILSFTDPPALKNSHFATARLGLAEVGKASARVEEVIRRYGRGERARRKEQKNGQRRKEEAENSLRREQKQLLKDE